MKRLTILITLGLCIPGAALAQSQEAMRFHGLKLGATATHGNLEARLGLPGVAGSLGAENEAWGYRGYLAVDSQVARSLVAGGEVGLSKRGGELEARTDTAVQRLEPGWTLDATGRLGFLPISTVLLYARGGYSWTRVEETTRFLDGRAERRDRRAEGGALYGAGIEAAVTTNLYVRAEYNRSHHDDELTASRVQVGVSARF